MPASVSVILYSTEQDHASHDSSAAEARLTTDTIARPRSRRRSRKPRAQTMAAAIRPSVQLRGAKLRRNRGRRLPDDAERYRRRIQDV